MCFKKECPKSQKCYRYRAAPDRDQRYYDFTYLCQENNEDNENNYRYFIVIRKDDRIVELDEVKELEVNEEKESQIELETSESNDNETNEE